MCMYVSMYVVLFSFKFCYLYCLFLFLTVAFNMALYMKLQFLLFFLCVISMMSMAYNPDYHKYSVEETVRKASPLLTKILKSLISNNVQDQANLDDHFSSISETHIPDIFSGKLRLTKNNWFQVLPTSIRTKDVSLRTIVGCVIASMGERLLKGIEMEAIDYPGEIKQRMEWAREKIEGFVKFLKRAICTLELVIVNQKNSSHYGIFMEDYLQVSKYLYKLAISAHKQISKNDKQNFEKEVACTARDIHLRDCIEDVSGILKQLKCLSLCQQQNHCRNKITKLKKTLRRVRRMFINSLFRLKRKGQKVD